MSSFSEHKYGYSSLELGYRTTNAFPDADIDRSVRVPEPVKQKQPSVAVRQFEPRTLRAKSRQSPGSPAPQPCTRPYPSTRTGKVRSTGTRLAVRQHRRVLQSAVSRNTGKFSAVNWCVGKVFEPGLREGLMNKRPCCWYCGTPTEAGAPASGACQAAAPDASSAAAAADSEHLSFSALLLNWSRAVVCRGCQRVLAERVVDLGEAPCTSWCGLHAWNLTSEPGAPEVGTGRERLKASEGEGGVSGTAESVDAAATVLEKSPALGSELLELGDVAGADPAADRLFEHFVVTPDMHSEPYSFLGFTGAPEDPFASQGLITSACFLLPRVDAFPLVTVHKVSGALAEMERLLSFLGTSSTHSSVVKNEHDRGTMSASSAVLVTPSRSQTPLEDSDPSEDENDLEAQEPVQPAEVSSSVSTRGQAGAEGRPSPAISVLLDEQSSSAFGDEDAAAGALLRAYVRVYFVILDVVYALQMESEALEKELIETALAMYRVCVERISLRNRIPEAFAVACILLAWERVVVRHTHRVPAGQTSPTDGCTPSGIESESLLQYRGWNPVFVRRVVEASTPVWPQASIALVYDYMRRVLNTLLERRPDTVEAISHEMPKYCALLGVSAAVADLAHSIAEQAVIHGVCARRTSVSVCAAAIYLANHLEDARRMPSGASNRTQSMDGSAHAAVVHDPVRLKQRDIAEKLQLSEVTLRKAHKEILTHLDVVLPAGYRPSGVLRRCLPPSYQRVAASALQRLATQEALDTSGQKLANTGDGIARGPGAPTDPAATTANTGEHRTHVLPMDANVAASRSSPASLEATLDTCRETSIQASQQPVHMVQASNEHQCSALAVTGAPPGTPSTTEDSAASVQALPRALGPAALLRQCRITTLPQTPGAASLRALLYQVGLSTPLVEAIVDAALARTLPVPIGLLLNLIDSGWVPVWAQASAATCNRTLEDATQTASERHARESCLAPPPPPPLPRLPSARARLTPIRDQSGALNTNP